MAKDSRPPRAMYLKKSAQFRAMRAGALGERRAKRAGNFRYCKDSHGRFQMRRKAARKTLAQIKGCAYPPHATAAYQLHSAAQQPTHSCTTAPHNYTTTHRPRTARETKIFPRRIACGGRFTKYPASMNRRFSAGKSNLLYPQNFPAKRLKTHFKMAAKNDRKATRHLIF